MSRIARRLLPSSSYAGTGERQFRQFDRNSSRDRQYRQHDRSGGRDRQFRQTDRYGGRPQAPDLHNTSPLRDLKQSWKGDAVYGYNPVLAALTAKRRTLHRLYIREGEEPKKGAALTSRLVKVAETAGIPVEKISKHDLNILTDNKAHQGYLLECSPLDFVPLDDLSKAAKSSGSRAPVWLALDEVTDVQNMGAALRSAFFLGVAGVLTCAKNSAPLSPAVSKASAGAVEHMTVYSCRNMQRTLQAAAEDGWNVYGAAAEEGSTPCTEVTVSKPTILVMGSEGSGLRTLVRRACTGLIRVDGLTDEAKQLGVDSLNVSVAAGILLHRLLNSAPAS